LLSVENMTVRYGGFLALDGISVNIKKGSVVGIVGTNGAGKSSFINAICGVAPKVSGKVVFDGQDISRAQPYQIARRGLVQVPEGRRLFPEMTVKENLAVAAIQKRGKAKRAESYELVYDLFPRLKEREGQLANTLSGGEQQMAAIGRALMAVPEVLLLDEMSLGLSPKITMEIFGVVLKMKEMGLTIGLVEQNVQHCLAVSDYAYVLETGRVVIEGTGREVAENPHTKAAYLGAGGGGSD
jgi:branched-chain amino acid transport system ATP-binding protein